MVGELQGKVRQILGKLYRTLVGAGPGHTEGGDCQQVQGQLSGACGGLVKESEGCETLTLG